MSSEILDIVDERGEIIGRAGRLEAHRDRLLHRVVHLLVFDTSGRLLLQKRSAAKETAPGKWDTSVGGHLESGETVLQALRREMEEELSLPPECAPAFIYSYIHSNPFEQELVYSFCCTHDGAVRFNVQEIDEIRFWEIPEITGCPDQGIFSDNFRDEIARYLSYSESSGHSPNA